MDDRESIERCIRAYFAAVDEGDPAGLAEAFHPDTVMYSSGSDGALSAVSQEAWKQRLASGGPRPARRREILALDRAGTVAMAKLRSEYDGLAFVDFVTLIRAGGRWQIVGKAFHREEAG